MQFSIFATSFPSVLRCSILSFNDVVRLFIFWDDRNKLTVLANLLVKHRVGDGHSLTFQTGSQRGALRGGVVGAKDLFFTFFSVKSGPFEVGRYNV